MQKAWTQSNILARWRATTITKTPLARCQRGEIQETKSAKHFHDAGAIWRCRFVETCPTAFAVFGQTRLPINRHGAVHDGFHFCRSAVFCANRNDRAASADRFGVKVRAFLNLASAGHGADDATRRAASSNACQRRCERTGSDHRSRARNGNETQTGNQARGAIDCSADAGTFASIAVGVRPFMAPEEADIRAIDADGLKPVRHLLRRAWLCGSWTRPFSCGLCCRGSRPRRLHVRRNARRCPSRRRCRPA